MRPAWHGSNSYRPISAARARSQQQTRRPSLLLSIDGTDRRTGGQTLDSFITLAAYHTDDILKFCRKAACTDVAESDGYFRVVCVGILAGQERSVEASPDHERVHRSLDVAVAIVAACDRTPVRLTRAYNQPRTTTTPQQYSAYRRTQPIGLAGAKPPVSDQGREEVKFLGRKQPVPSQPARESGERCKLPQ